MRVVTILAAQRFGLRHRQLIDAQSVCHNEIVATSANLSVSVEDNAQLEVF